MTQAKDDSEIPGTVAYEAARAERLQEIIDKQAARIEQLEAALQMIILSSKDGASIEVARVALAPEQKK